MNAKTTFPSLLAHFRKIAHSERDKGDRFERLMQAWLRTDPQFEHQFSHIWLWSDFPARHDFGSVDAGIDLVARTHGGDFWAIQCKCFQEGATIDKPAVDTFLSTSSRRFSFEKETNLAFSHRLWMDTTGRKFGPNAEEAIQNQHPKVSRIGLSDLEQSPVDWEKLEKGIFGDAARLAKKLPRQHQLTAIAAANDYFKTKDRGKLIMACGTGKTFTSLKIAEKETGGTGLVLFLVPSIALLGQTLREWFAEADEPLRAICICSDPKVSKKESDRSDTGGVTTVDLALPATTDTRQILRQFDDFRNAPQKSGLTVVFSTYQSIESVAAAQRALLEKQVSVADPFGIFDLIVCDEAHRTTGVTLSGDDESSFVKVHDNAFLKAKKRLYMTATPRLYHEDAKMRAAQADAVLCSMDESKFYGELIYHIGFGKAVEGGLLADYKVLVLAISESDMPLAVQNSLTKGGEIATNDMLKLVGCVNALSKKMLGDAGVLQATDPEPMRRAVAFCPSIKDSQGITRQFNKTRETYLPSLDDERRSELVATYSRHVDGTMSALAREAELSWLKAAPEAGGECRILTNARCLSEGVDVPSLDAVLFLSARNSQVDVVQSVGRVMRRSPGKKYGYIIIPVVTPSDVEPEAALADNDRFRVVWTVLNALRAHDDRFNATVNKIELNKRRPDQILVGRMDSYDDANSGASARGGDNPRYSTEALAAQLSLQFEQLQSAVFAKLVQKVGDRRYWEQWAKDVADIAERQIERIERLIKEDGEHQKAFADFLAGLQKNIHPAIEQAEAIEMLSQHLITKPVFEALFEGYSFVKNNPISIAMQQMLDLLEAGAVEKDTETLHKFYESVRSRASGIDNAEGRQRIIVELYDKFFKTAFPKMVEQLGIVYTPVEVVDFIVRSADFLLRKEFDRSISDENIHVLDPFTGTGTFITRLLQSGLIRPEDLDRKYRHELHANEIVLLAYYIAAVNIENAYHDLRDEGRGMRDENRDEERGMRNERDTSSLIPHSSYLPFDGICLTDTFQLGENEDSEKLFSAMFPQNSARVVAQKNAPLRVIIGNPPYSVGQKSANDNAQNQEYPKLDARIGKTYAALSKATNKNSLYDSYIKAFRWSSDRLDAKNGGIIAFVSNGAWLDDNSKEGFRKCLEKEFSSIYVFNLRGNQRTSGELSRKEGGKIFGSGSRTPIAVTFLVKKPNAAGEKATIYYHDIGDYLSREEKLKIVNGFRSIENEKMGWQVLQPNEHGDWLNLRDDAFGQFLALGDKDDKSNQAFFNQVYSRGLASARDAWCYNSQKFELEKNIKNLIDFYNEQREAFKAEKLSKPKIEVENFVTFDSTKITWNRGLKEFLEKNKPINFEEKSIVKGLYRPFFKQHLYFSRELNDMVYQIPKLFPDSKIKNLVICVSGLGGSKVNSSIITDEIPDLNCLDSGTQCFPLHYYEEKKTAQIGMFDSAEAQWARRDGVSDFILTRARQAYGSGVSKEDIFYYVYGFLHSPAYRERFSSDLKKMLPRLPLLESPEDFWAFSRAGRELAKWHLGYETAGAPEGVLVNYGPAHTVNYRVEKMRFASKTDKSIIAYNPQISIENIPAEAYEYVVNGKPAIEWVMERYAVTTHKDSGIRNDPNDWAAEAGNPKYILEVLLGVIRVSLETVRVVRALPGFEM